MILGEPTPVTNTEPACPDVFNIPREDAHYYIHTSVGEEQNCAVVAKSQQIHGISYVDYGYFDPSGQTENGSLVPELDGTRGEKNGKRIANYLLASRIGAPIDEANSTVRLLDIGDNGSIEDLPTYSYFKDIFDADTKTKLNEIIELYGKNSLREVAALATIDADGHHGSFELIRALIQNSMIKECIHGSPELYIASLTNKSLRPVLGFISCRSARLLGGPTQIFSDDPRSRSIYVTPVLMDLSSALKNTMDDIEAAETDSDKRKLEAKLRFISDGLSPAFIEKYTVDFPPQRVSEHFL